MKQWYALYVFLCSYDVHSVTILHVPLKFLRLKGFHQPYQPNHHPLLQNFACWVTW